jgi:fructose-bisphosphate aldolase class II
MLVSAKEMLIKAKNGRYAVGQFNINNLEWAKAVLLTAEECKSPVILGVSEGAGKYMCGYKTVVGMVNGMLEGLNISVPVALHLDHGSYDGALACIEAGFSSVMYDGSHEPIEQNISNTTKLVEICNNKGLSLEAEVGSIGGEEDGVIGTGECADPDECKRIADLGVTMLAAGIGNIHGRYPDNWKGLDFDTLKKVSDKVGIMPLVLHGGTGIADNMIKEAISLGVAKINVNTECQWAFQNATRDYITKGKDLLGKGLDIRTLKAVFGRVYLVENEYVEDLSVTAGKKIKSSTPFRDTPVNGFDPRKLLAPGFAAIKAVVREKMELFGSEGKA